jgi:very-short-patch-repair endonuclease
MRGNQKHSRPYLKDRRKALRKDLTYAEACLWILLKNKQLEGRKFRRQHSIENYIVDFYCASEKLVIEVDGSIHDNLGQADADELRDRRLQILGFKTLRLDNDLVINYPDMALQLIKDNFTTP